MKNNTITIDLLRHGETLAAKRMIGSTDVPLSDQGYTQMQKAVCSQPQYSRIISSPLQRCATFARDYAEDKNISLEIEDALKEYHFGDWENHLTETIWQQQPQALEKFWADPENCPPPNAENLLSFQRRIEGAFKQIIQQAESEHLLLITHGGVIRCLLGALLAMPLTKMTCLKISHASLSRIVIYVEDGKITPSISFVNQRVSL